MNKADIVFYLSTAVLVWNNIQQAVHGLVSDHSYQIINVVFVVVSTAAFALYERINGTPIVPPAPAQ